jgi:hypothetical protein
MFLGRGKAALATGFGMAAASGVNDIISQRDTAYGRYDMGRTARAMLAGGLAGAGLAAGFHRRNLGTSLMTAGLAAGVGAMASEDQRGGAIQGALLGLGAGMFGAGAYRLGRNLDFGAVRGQGWRGSLRSYGRELHAARNAGEVIAAGQRFGSRSGAMLSGAWSPEMRELLGRRRGIREGRALLGDIAAMQSKGQLSRRHATQLAGEVGGRLGRLREGYAAAHTAAFFGGAAEPVATGLSSASAAAARKPWRARRHDARTAAAKLRGEHQAGYAQAGQAVADWLGRAGG